MHRHRALDEILRLDPREDYERIVYLITCYEFPWDTTRSLELALFRTYDVPSISALLDSTGEFRHRPQRRCQLERQTARPAGGCGILVA